MDSYVIFVSNTVKEDHNPQPSWKDQKQDKWLSIICPFGSIVAVYVGLPCELSKLNSIFKQSIYVG
jgi:hypothetical protein